MKKYAGHIQYDWWKYVAALLVPLILWSSVFSILKKPKANERLHILVLGDGINAQQMERDLSEYLRENSSQELKSVQVVIAKYSDENFANQLVAATYSYDIIIIDEEQMKETVGQDYFFVLPEELREAEIQWYQETVNDIAWPFGAVIFDGEPENTFGKYYSGTRKCYAFISPQTENLYPLNSKSKEGNNAAVLAWQWLMEKL